jgi:hypothetical protein
MTETKADCTRELDKLNAIAFTEYYNTTCPPILTPHYAFAIYLKAASRVRTTRFIKLAAEFCKDMF